MISIGFGLSCIGFMLRGIWIGLVLWTSMLAAAAFLQAMLLTYCPKRSVLLLGSASMGMGMVMLGLLS